jgi:D-alanine-D-alanine ligase
MKKTYFDYVYILGHGKNIEDGTLSSYFFIKKIPYLYDDLNNVSLLQDKIKSKMMFQHLKVPTLDYFSLHQGHKISSKSIPFAYPLIVKPNTLGSSIGVSQVNDFSSLISALQEIYLYDETCIIEPCVTKKKEYNIALSGYLDELKISHIECVNSFDDVLSFYDKYDYSSSNKKRIIDPLIDEAIKNQMIDDAKKIFNSLNLCGTYRFDFLFDEVNQQLYLNEINVLPGSLAFYLFEKETKMIDLILFDIKMKEKKYFKREHLLTSYQEGYITQLAIEKMIK